MSKEQNRNLLKPARLYWKFVAGFLAIIIAVIAGLLGWQRYELWQKQKNVQRAAEALKRFEQEDYQRAMADTYGGKTPQETLQMYIDAVEKDDYELASKYFIGDYQEKELRRLKNIIENGGSFTEYFSFLKKAESWRSSLEENEFIMTSKTNLGPSIFIRFKKYPNGIWKIIEI